MAAERADYCSGDISEHTAASPAKLHRVTRGHSFSLGANNGFVVIAVVPQILFNQE